MDNRIVIDKLDDLHQDLKSIRKLLRAMLDYLIEVNEEYRKYLEEDS